MTWGKFDDRENKAVPTHRQPDPRHEIHTGDILVSRANTEAYVGAPVLVGQCRPRLLLSDKSLRLLPAKEIDRRWLVYALSSPATRRQISAKSTGAQESMRNISQGSLADVEIPLPPLAEQSRIADALEDHLSRLDAASIYLSSAYARLTKFHRAIHASIFLGESAFCTQNAPSREEILTRRAELYGAHEKRGRPDPTPPRPWYRAKFPSHWTVCSLEEVTHPTRTISYGILKPGPNQDRGVPYIRVLNMRGDQIDTENLHRTTDAIDAQYSRSRLTGDDVLVSIRGTFGRVCLVPESLAGANITQDTARLAFLDFVDPRFACIYLRSSYAQQYFGEVARGVAVKGVNIGDLRDMPFPVPSLTDQRAIVEHAERLMSEFDAVVRATRLSTGRVAHLRSAILRKAIAGKLVPQDMEDEPASELLKRIDAERQIAAKATQSRKAPPAPRSAPPTHTNFVSAGIQEELPL